MANERQEIERERQSEQTTLDPVRHSPLPVRGLRSQGAATPFSLMRKLSDEMDRMFDDLFGSIGLPGLAWRERQPAPAQASMWWPDLDVFEQAGKLVVVADLPGLTKDDVKVETRDGELYISGERKLTEERDRRYYLQERDYGSFDRVVALPEGAKAETASATFENGVLRIEIEVPGSRARRVDVRESKPS